MSLIDGSKGVLDVVFNIAVGLTDYELRVTAENGLEGKHLLRLVRSAATATALSTLCFDNAQLKHPSEILSQQGNCYTLHPTFPGLRLIAVADGEPGERVMVRAHPYDSAAVVRIYARGKFLGEDADAILTLVETNLAITLEVIHENEY